MEAGVVCSEHGHERLYSLGELAAATVGSLGEPPDLAGSLELGVGVVRLDELDCAVDSRGRGRGRESPSPGSAFGVGICVGTVAISGALHGRKEKPVK